ncbi:Tar (HIV-1) RNA binding protein 1 [Cladochytrium tenue]|nr:Tar (HIV-1) RNA binding protein 1 [Cladochytrium tenue]
MGPVEGLERKRHVLLTNQLKASLPGPAAFAAFVHASIARLAAGLPASLPPRSWSADRGLVALVLAAAPCITDDDDGDVQRTGARDAAVAAVHDAFVAPVWRAAMVTALASDDETGEEMRGELVDLALFAADELARTSPKYTCALLRDILASLAPLVAPSNGGPASGTPIASVANAAHLEFPLRLLVQLLESPPLPQADPAEHVTDTTSDPSSPTVSAAAALLGSPAAAGVTTDGYSSAAALLDAIFRACVGALGRLPPASPPGTLAFGRAVPALLRIAADADAVDDTTGGLFAAWCRALWDRVAAIAAVDSDSAAAGAATNACIAAAFAVLCPSFDTLFALSHDPRRKGALRFGGAAGVGLDLRREPVFWDLVQRGLLSQDFLVEKLSMYLLRRVVSFSEAFGKDAQMLQACDRRFKWDQTAVKRTAKVWNDFLVMLETIAEPGVHLVEPMLPRLPFVLNEWSSVLDESWWVVLLQRGIFHDDVPIRKQILEYAIAVKDPKHAAVLLAHPTFLFDRLVPQLDLSAHYLVSGYGLFVSPFGELVRKFIQKLVDNAPTLDEKHHVLRRITVAAAKFVNRIASLYVLMGLSDVAASADAKRTPLSPFGTLELDILRELIDGHRAVTVWSKPDSRRLLRLLVLRLCAAFTAPAAAPLEDVARLVFAYTANDPPLPGSAEFEILRRWMIADRRAPGTDIELQMDANGVLGLMVKGFLESQGPSREFEIKQSRYLALMAHYHLPISTGGTPAAVDHNSTVVSFGALSSRLARLRTGSHYAAPGTTHRALVLLGALIDYPNRTKHDAGPAAAVDAAVTAAAVTHRISSILPHPIRDSFADVVSVTVTLLLDSHDVDMPTAGALAGLLASLCSNFSDASVEQRPLPLASMFADHATLAAWFSAWLARCLELLRSPDGALVAQQQKISALRILEVLLSSDSFAPFTTTTAFDETFARSVLFDVRFVKSLGSNDDRHKDWGDLQAQFQAAQFNLAHAVVRHGSPCSGLLPACADLLRESSHRTAAAALGLAAALLSSQAAAASLPADADVAAVVAAGLDVVTENWSVARHFLPLVDAYVAVAFHPTVISGDVGELTNQAVEKAAAQFLEWGNQKMTVVPKMSAQLWRVWHVAAALADRHAAPAGAAADADTTVSAALAASRGILRFADIFVALLLFGPYREKDRDEHRLDATTAYNLRVLRTGPVDEDIAG